MIEFALFLLLLVGLTQIYMYRNRFISPILVNSLAIYILFWNAFPFLYSIIMSERTYNISSNPTYQYIIVIQLFSVFSILILLNFLVNFRPKSKYFLLSQQKDIDTNTILTLLVVMFFVLVFTNIYSINAIGLTFLDRIQYAVSARNKEDTIRSILSSINSYIIIPFAIACLFPGIRTAHDNKWISRLSIAIVAIHIVFMIIFGMRSFIFMPMILIVIYWKVYTPQWRKLANIIVVLLMFMLLLVAPFLSNYLRTIRAMESYSIKDFSGFFSSEFSTIGDYNLAVLDDIYTKFNSFEQGTTLLEREGTSRVGTSLITSALTSPIPRILFPTKPVPFSSNGEYSGIPYYMVPNLREYVLQGHVVPIPPSTIALWELGYIGLFMMIIINVINLSFINIFLKSELLIYRAAGFFLITMPTFEFLLAPTGWIIKEGLRIFIILFIINMLFPISIKNRKVYRLKNRTIS